MQPRSICQNCETNMGMILITKLQPLFGFWVKFSHFGEGEVISWQWHCRCQSCVSPPPPRGCAGLWFISFLAQPRAHTSCAGKADLTEKWLLFLSSSGREMPLLLNPRGGPLMLIHQHLPSIWSSGRGMSVCPGIEAWHLIHCRNRGDPRSTSLLVKFTHYR